LKVFGCFDRIHGRTSSREYSYYSRDQLDAHPAPSRFICSSNNNITRITKMVKSLCAQYSPPLVSLLPPMPTATRMPTPSESDGTNSCSATPVPEPELESYHPFPPPSRLSSPDVVATLRSLGFGYRADFIQKTAKMLGDAYRADPSLEGKEGPESWLYTLRDMSTTNARQELLKLMGVGRKVADCILLMSLNKVGHRWLLPSFRSKLSG
jgi:N-glycosylase/DNA lyase